MNKSSFFIAGQHAVIEALRNPNRKVLRVFLTEDAKKNIHRKNPKTNIFPTSMSPQRRGRSMPASGWRNIT